MTISRILLTGVTDDEEDSEEGGENPSGTSDEEGEDTLPDLEDGDEDGDGETTEMKKMKKLTLVQKERWFISVENTMTKMVQENPSQNTMHITTKNNFFQMKLLSGLTKR